MNKAYTIVFSWLFVVPAFAVDRAEEGTIPAEVAAEATAVEELDMQVKKAGAQPVQEKMPEQQGLEKAVQRTVINTETVEHEDRSAPTAVMAVAVQAHHKGRVYRSAFTTAIQDREPVDELDALTNNVNKLYFFTDLRGLTGQEITHQWWHEDELIAEVHFRVGGPRWRVWSSKTLLPSWTGQWRVAVVDGEGQVIDEAQLQYEAADAGGTSGQHTL